MENVIGIAFMTVATAQVVGTIAYLVQAGRLLRRLEGQHKAVHESIGSPLLLANNTPRNNILFLGWIWNREFETLGDADSIAMAKLVRTLLISLLFGLAVLIALLLLLSATI